MPQQDHTLMIALWVGHICSKSKRTTFANRYLTFPSKIPNRLPMSMIFKRVPKRLTCRRSSLKPSKASNNGTSYESQPTIIIIYLAQPHSDQTYRLSKAGLAKASDLSFQRLLRSTESDIQLPACIATHIASLLRTASRRKNNSRRAAE